MKGGSSFASKNQPGPSVEEKCPTAKEGFGNIFYYDEGLENGTVTVISILLGKLFDVSKQLWMHFHLPSTQKEFMSQPLQYTEKMHEYPYSVLEFGSKNTKIYNLDVSLISDFLDLLMTESMIVAALGTAETGGRRPIW